MNRADTWFKLQAYPMHTAFISLRDNGTCLVPPMCSPRSRRWQLRAVHKRHFRSFRFSSSDGDSSMLGESMLARHSLTLCTSQELAVSWSSLPVMLCRLSEGLVDGLAPCTALIPTHAIQALCIRVSESQCEPHIHNWSLHATPRRELRLSIPSHDRVAFGLAARMFLFSRRLARCQESVPWKVPSFQHERWRTNASRSWDFHQSDDWHELCNTVADNVLLSPVQATSSARSSVRRCWLHDDPRGRAHRHYKCRSSAIVVKTSVDAHGVSAFPPAPRPPSQERVSPAPELASWYARTATSTF